MNKSERERNEFQYPMTQKSACNAMIVILISALLLHFSILTQLIDYRNVWGGKLANEMEMYVFETISICFNAFLLFTILQKAGYIKQHFSNKVISIVLWSFVFVFGINTIGNLFANNLFEQIAGTAVTLISSILCFVIVRDK